MSLQMALDLSSRLLFFSMFVQQLEYFRVPSAFSRGALLERSFFGLAELLPKVFLSLIGLALLGVFFPAPYMLLPFLVLNLVIFISLGGPFCGGSDSMSFLALLCVFLAQVFPRDSRISLAAFAYLAMHAMLSYFVAGWVKLRSAQWRSGAALKAYCELPLYETPGRARRWIQARAIAPIVSWAVVLFELSFPLSIFCGVKFSVAYLCIGLLFHLGIFALFGLNRFLFAWLATYPAIFYFAGYFS